MASFQGILNLPILTGTNGFKLNGVAPGDWAGVFDMSTDLAISLGGANAITPGDILL